jgi:hypothetical protein
MVIFEDVDNHEDDDRDASEDDTYDPTSSASDASQDHDTDEDSERKKLDVIIKSYCICCRPHRRLPLRVLYQIPTIITATTATIRMVKIKHHKSGMVVWDMA